MTLFGNDCFICEKDGRPLVEARVKFRKDNADYDMVVIICLDCMFESHEKWKEKHRTANARE